VSKRDNSKKDQFLKSITAFTIEDVWADISCRCRFNFSYLDITQQYSQDPSGWDEENLQKLFGKLKHYSSQPLSYWQQQTVGSHKNHVLEVYGAFPRKSKFTHPSHVPADVDWARFRLDGKKRFIGFMVPKGHCMFPNSFVENTFYVVFLDPEHMFYLGK